MIQTISLNEAQEKAVKTTEGPLVVFAGAGSGKTRVITARIAEILSKGVNPRKVLAVTFTNKAALEMQSRVMTLCGSEAMGTHIATFHSSCARWLREFANELGFSSGFSIFDEDDSTAALKALLKQNTEKTELAMVLSECRRFIHYVKMQGWFPGDVMQRGDELSRLKMIPTAGIDIYKKYQEYLAQCNAMDFDDLLMNMLLLLKKNQRVLQYMQRRYQYVMVDEYQDTNQVQFELIKFLCDEHKNLCVVGDDDQSIYSWRGAAPKNILNFEKHFPGAKRILLEKNYRCTGNIVNAAAAVIANNKVRAPKVLATDNPPGDKIEIAILEDADVEAQEVVRAINRERQDFIYSDIAIFYRTNAQSRAVEESLRMQAIPYKIFGSLRFYERMEIKDLLAYLRLVVNHKDDVSFRRILNVPTRGLGDAALLAVERHATQIKAPLLQAARELAEKNISRVSSKLQQFLAVFADLEQRFAGCGLAAIVDVLVSAISYKAYLEKKYSDQFEDKIDNVHELANAMEQYARRNPETSLNEWLQAVSLSSSEESEQEGPTVSLMTLHSAKGLEFKRVFLVGVEDGILPHRNSMDLPEQLEEERRLFYVGMTRAMKKLSLFAAIERRTFDKTMSNTPSRFLREIPDECLQIRGEQQGLAEGVDLYSGVSYDFEENSHAPSKRGKISQMVQGARVHHPTYGFGTVESIEQKFGTSKVCVCFQDFGLRKVEAHHLQLRQ